MSDDGAREQTCLADRYELGEQLGHGMFGAVYRAFDRRLHRNLAVKILRRVDGASRLSLRSEFRSAALGGQVDEVRREDLEWLMNINFFGVATLTRALLPRLRRRPDTTSQTSQVSSAWSRRRDKLRTAPANLLFVGGRSHFAGSFETPPLVSR